MKSLVTDFGADPTHQSDSTAAIQAALDVGGDILVDEGAYLVSAPLIVHRPTRLIGEGMRSVFLATGAFQPNYPVFNVNPDMQHGADGYEFRDFQIAPASPGVKAASIFFNTLGAGQYLRRPVIDGLVISQMADQAIVSSNSNGDGLAALQIRNCTMMGGIFLQNVGDSVVIEKNIISGEGIAAYATFAPGAANMVVRDNNMTGKGGAIYMTGAIAPTFEANNIEATNYGYTGSVNALCFLNACQSTSFIGNNVNAGGQADGLRIVSCRRTFIDRNFFSVAGSAKKHIRREADYLSLIWQHNTFIDNALGAEVAGYIV